MVTVVKPPEWIKRTIFLAGSIENGKAEDWQSRAAEILKDKPFTLISPRRDDWDPEWTSDSDSHKLRTQIQWELHHLEVCDAVLMHFDAETVSAISLLELGLYARSGKLVVSCPSGFWRLANVEVTCAKYAVPMARSLEGAIQHLIQSRFTSGL